MDLLRVPRGVASRTRTTERPGDEADALDATQARECSRQQLRHQPSRTRSTSGPGRRSRRTAPGSGAARARPADWARGCTDRSSPRVASIGRSRSCPPRTRRSRPAPDTPSSCSPDTARRRRLPPACPRRARTARRDRPVVHRAPASRHGPARERRAAPAAPQSPAPTTARGRSDRSSGSARCRRPRVARPGTPARRSIADGSHGFGQRRARRLNSPTPNAGRSRDRTLGVGSWRFGS